MATETEFTIGARASCSDGPCGEVRRIIVDPAAGTVTHLVIEDKHRHQPGRLVPLDLVDTTAGEVRLSCTIAEFNELDPAEEEQVVEGRGAGVPTAPGGAPTGIPHLARVTVKDVVPVGEAEISPGDLGAHGIENGELVRAQRDVQDSDVLLEPLTRLAPGTGTPSRSCWA